MVVEFGEAVGDEQLREHLVGTLQLLVLARELPVRLLARDTYDSLSKIAGVAAPLIVIHGTDDATVPVHMGLTLLAAANEPKFELVLDGAGHADVNEFGAAEKVIAILDNLPTMAEPR